MTIRFRRTGGGLRAASGLLLCGSAVGGAIGITGCGGHHNSSSTPAATLTATIDWPARSRDITNVSSSAVACIITDTEGDPPTGDAVDFPPIIRPQNADGSFVAGATTTSWSSPTQVGLNKPNIQVRFYATLPTGSTSGVANDTIAANYSTLPSVGDALVPITITTSPTDLGTITVSGSIAKLLVPATTVNFGNTTTLTATGYDSTGTILIALSPGSTFFSVPANPSFTCDLSGDITATGLGSAVVSAYVTGGPTAGSTVSTTAQVSAIVGTDQLTTSSLGIPYRDAPAGTGVAAQDGAVVGVEYTGYYSNDPANNVDSGSYTAFDSAYSGTVRTVKLGVGAIPNGLNNAIVGMAVGGTRIVVIPASQTAGLNIPTSAPAGAPAIYIIHRAS